MKIKSIFLSSTSDSSLPILHFCREHSIHLVRESFISFEKIPFKPPVGWEVVFFSSPRSVDFFLSETLGLMSNQEIACIGSETKKHLESFGYPVAFFGENAGDPGEIASQFKTWLGNRVALFPQSTKSNKSIESELPDAQKIPLLVYETIHDPIPLKDSFSVYVFTSPSNYASFRSVNSIPTDATIIAWGITTAQFLLNDHQKADFILKTATYSELLEILQDLNG